jgi:hypothetical protein
LHRLARIDADADPQRDLELLGGFAEPRLKIDAGADRRTSRGEDEQRFVAANLDELAAVLLALVGGDARELL